MGEGTFIEHDAMIGQGSSYQRRPEWVSSPIATVDLEGFPTPLAHVICGVDPWWIARDPAPTRYEGEILRVLCCLAELEIGLLATVRHATL